MTLVETSVVASVLAVVTSLAVPSFQDAVQRRHLEGAARQLETDIHYTRTMAVASNVPIRISFEAGTGGTCYITFTPVRPASAAAPVPVPMLPFARVRRRQNAACSSLQTAQSA